MDRVVEPDDGHGRCGVASVAGAGAGGVYDLAWGRAPDVDAASQGTRAQFREVQETPSVDEGAREDT